MADLYVVANNHAKVRAQWTATRIFVGEGKGFWITGKNATGALNNVPAAPARAHVNIIAIDAMAVGGCYGSG